jgi:hypothetical protein
MVFIVVLRWKFRVRFMHSLAPSTTEPRSGDFLSETLGAEKDANIDYASNKHGKGNYDIG